VGNANVSGEFFAGKLSVASLALTGTCGIVSLADSIGVLTAPDMLRYYRFRNLTGCNLRTLGTFELVNPGTVTGTFTQPNMGTAGPGGLPGDIWWNQRNAYSVTAGGTMPADNTPNDLRVYDVEVPPITNGFVYRPRGSGQFLDGTDVTLSFIAYRNATGIGSFTVAATDYNVTTEYARITNQSANGAAGAVQYKIPSTGVRNHGTNGFRLRAKLTGGSVVATGANLIHLDAFVEVNGASGQTFATLAQAGVRAADYLNPSNVSAANFAAQLQLLRASVVFITLDENAGFNHETPATYAANINALIDLCKTANPAMQCALFSQYDNTAGMTSAELRALADAGRALALSRADTVWLDCNASMGDTAWIIAAGLVDADGVHPSTGTAYDAKKSARVIMAKNELLEIAHAANTFGPVLKRRGPPARMNGLARALRAGRR
jgi:hypothetical protein